MLNISPSVYLSSKNKTILKQLFQGVEMLMQIVYDEVVDSTKAYSIYEQTIQYTYTYPYPNTSMAPSNFLLLTIVSLRSVT